jgi:DNA-binding transcriptional LysR family regulator
MSKKIPPLGAVRAFEAAARHASFARAAAELHVTPAAVSHQVKQLEHWLGTKLFARTANGVTLTAAGYEYATRTREAFDRLISVSHTVRERKRARVVTIKAQHSIATLWLMPRVLAMSRTEPDIELRLFVGEDRPGNKIGADLAIFHQRPDVPGWDQRLFSEGVFRLHAAPGLAAQIARMTPRELMAQPLLHTTFVDRAWRYPTLEDWFRAAGVPCSDWLPGLHFNLMHLTTAACVAGAGIALLLDEACSMHVANGALVALPGPTLPNPHAFYLMSPKRPTEAVRRVREVLLRDAPVVSRD